ncbi:single-stranded DNA-binding protein [Ligilactobacillus agilis]|uniref:single-stranded DNA-binding protein n=1 Tax=Ligilactobacillus agilis TaxID=1601 RepID=UPI00191EAE21|nr:single-stranded DNA-binding protein [Ligilactobacillus agilis]MBL1054844.1 single-stranded DNA-binding protein [Ligilactobacillus agilis]
MLSFAKVTLYGNLVANLNIYNNNNQSQRATFTVAVNKTKYNPQTGTYFNVPTYVDCVLWDNSPSFKFITQNAHKGTRIYLTGELEVNKYTNNQNVEIKRYEVRVSEAHLDNNYGNNYRRTNNQQAPNKQQYQQYQQNNTVPVQAQQMQQAPQYQAQQQQSVVQANQQAQQQATQAQYQTQGQTGQQSQQNNQQATYYNNSTDIGSIEDDLPF